MHTAPWRESSASKDARACYPGQCIARIDEARRRARRHPALRERVGMQGRSELGRVLGAAGRIARWAEGRPLALSVLALVIATFASWIMARAAGYPAIEAAVAHTKLEWLVLLFAARFAAFAGYTLAHGSTLTVREGIPMDTRMKLVAFGSSATSLSGGFSLDRRAIQRAGATPKEATLRVLSLGALEWATLAPIAWVCASMLLGSRHVQDAVAVPWVIGVPLGGLLAGLAVWRLSPRALARKGAPARALGRAIEALALLPRQLRRPVRGGAGLLGMWLYWAAEIVSLWAALQAFGVHAGLAVLILGYATGHVLTPRSAPLSGAGVTEILLPLALSWVGLPLAGAVPAAFSYRAGILLLSIPPALLARAEVQRLVGTSAINAA
jgi:uncharacterized membrane protein YbhN (UPF0104 family)